MNAHDYVYILENVFLPSLTERYPNLDPIYIIEDNSSVHTAGIVNNWYNQHPRLKRLNHPPKSPDLNWIENVWSIITRDWMPQAAQNIALLDQRVHESWDTLMGQQNLFETLSRSMPRRLEAVIEAEGGHVNY